jgi:hypothetical protein
MQGYRLCARPMPLRPASTINASCCTKAISTARQRTPDLPSHHCSANRSSDGNSLAATPRNPRSSLTLLLLSHLYARSAPSLGFRYRGTWCRPQLPVPARTCSAIRRIAWLLRSTSSEEVAHEDTLIRMARRPFQIVPPHQHVPSS